MILIQETTFVKETPFQLNGFRPIRTERKTAINADGNLIGGGILTLIKSGVQHNVPNSNILPDNDHTSDAHVIDIYLANSIICATNIYVPPIKESDPNDHRIQNFKPTLLPSGKNCLILGDLNAHSPIWDQWQPRNSIGELIEDFVVDKDLTILNEGSATFISPATGGSSAPDISICGADIAPKITWLVYPATLGSDHHSILMDIEVPGPKGQNKPKKNMAYNKANWDTFQRQIDITLSNPQTNLDPNENSDKMNAKLTNIIIDSAKKSIPVGSSRNRKPWWNAEIDTALKERTALKARANHSDEDRKA
ncbi:hypothetical protein ElyMa_000494200 [Elysia marginata]|uniref:Endonuclease/exonuclease/phosphatase domain-containing protein n=1 Tax=Elysia marginata TaxID=1093978 RepID=A0AAV4FX58_9GAST|nr:hypothetical protein ElyMa_000494200 [Elysia marginata]